jgi:ABC-type phosphate transport system permease subunit
MTCCYRWELRVVHLLKVTAFNLPRATRLLGVLLALLVGMVHLWVATHAPMPVYVSGLLIAAAVGSVLAAVGLVVGFRSGSWRLAVAVSGLCIGGYIVSRTIGFPGFSAAVGAWHYPLGTLALMLEAVLLAVYISLLVGWNVDSPGQRDWDTYFSRLVEQSGLG